MARRVLTIMVGLLAVETLLAVVGVDLRGVPDALAGAVLVVALGGVLAVLVHAGQTRGGYAAWWTWIAAAAVAVITAAVLAVVADWKTWLAVVAFLLCAVALVIFLGLTLATLVAVVWRRWRSASRLAVAAGLAVALVAVAGSVVWWLNPDPPTVPSRFASSAQLDNYLQKLIGSGTPPSVSVVVEKDGSTIYSRALGEAYAPSDVSARTDSVYKWWSTTKVVTAVAVLQLAEQHRLRLDQPVQELLPSFRPTPERRAARITVAELLNHSAGLPNNLPQVVSWMHLEDEAAPEQTRLFEQRFGEFAEVEREPGTIGVYSNVDYMVLGAVIERASGVPYERYVIDHVLKPLGMTHTAFAYTPWMRAHEAVGSHPAANVQTMFLPVVDPLWPTAYIRGYRDGIIWFKRFLADNTPPTGLIGTAPDMMRLARAILAGGVLDGHRILSRASVRTMLAAYQVRAGASPERDEIHATDVRHGVAWFVVRDGGRLYYEHSGGGPGWTSLMRIYPTEHLAIVVMSNSTVTPANKLAEAIAQGA